MIVLGIGAGITFPVVGAAAVASVSGGRFATATGLNSISRQLGAVLGVSLLVAIIGTPSPAEVADAFDHGWTFAAACFLAVALGSLLIGRVERTQAEDEIPGRPEQAEHRTPAARLGVAGSGAERAVAAPARPRTPREILHAVPLFAGLGDEALAEVASRVTSVRLDAGDVLFRRGDAASALYAVVSGRLEVLVDESGDAEILRVLGPGAVVGELALLADSPRSATIRARRDTELLELRRAEFERLMGSDAGFTAELVREMGLQLQRSRALEQTGSAPASTIAIVSATGGARFDAICDALVDGIAAHGRTIRVDPPSGEDVAGHAHLLERYESEFDQIVLVAPDLDGWARFCVRQADRTALVAGGSIPGTVEQLPELRGCDLLFAIDDGGAPSLARWLNAFEPRTQHVIESGERHAESVVRAARRLVGRSVGVVLSGGGARALAHIGALDELLAAGVSIDRVGGCDTGALIGAMFAMGMEPDEIDARCYEEWVRRSPLSDYRIPRTSLLRGDRVRALLERNLPGTIEELPREFFCVSGDLVSGGLVVHRRGDLAQAVLASMSLPGLISPTVMDGRLLVDGAMLNNLPVDVMASTDDGPIIAIDVTAKEPPPTSDGSSGRTRTRRLRRRAAEAEEQEQLPALGETLLRGLMLGSAGPVESARGRADLLITPSSEGAGMFEYHQLDVLKASGHRAAAEALEHAPASIADPLAARSAAGSGLTSASSSE